MVRQYPDSRYGIVGPVGRPLPSETGPRRGNSGFRSLSCLLLAAAVSVEACGSGPTEAPRNVIAVDSFNRSTVSGLGTADRGGTWQEDLIENASVSVDGSSAAITFTGAGSAAYNKLPITAADQEIALSFATNIVYGSTLRLEIDARVVDVDTSYYLLVRLRDPNPISLAIERQEQGVRMVLASEEASSEVHVADNLYRIKFFIAGVNPTTLSAKIWQDGAREPSDWLVTARDSAPVLQLPGAFEFGVYSSADFSSTPLTWTFDQFLIAEPSTP